MLQSVPCDNLISCRNIYEEADGGLTCVGEMRVLTDDGCAREKLFILSLAVPFFESLYRLDVVSEISETVGGLNRRKNGRGYSPSLPPRPGLT